MNTTEINARISDFTLALEAYLDGHISHSQIRSVVDSHFDAFANSKVWQCSSYIPGEHTFWTALWATQHLADEGHWAEGITISALRPILEILKGRSDHPSTSSGLRPY
jgi:hypothetical protein